MTMIKRPYRALADFAKVYDFLIENYTRDWSHGFCAPAFEYAQHHPNYQATLSHRMALWEDDGRLVALCGYEMTLGEALCVLSDGYDDLIDDLIDHAEQHIHTKEKHEFFFAAAQTTLREAATRRGYQMTASWPTKIYEYRKGPPVHHLPDGYRLISSNDQSFDPVRLQRCTWKGFNHEDEGEMEPNPDQILHMAAAPHFRPGLDVIIVAPDGEYVCYGGIWYIQQNRLAYLEPLCTVPKHRRRGLAAAVIAELYHKTNALGADHMTGGNDLFYDALGFETAYINEIWSLKAKN